MARKNTRKRYQRQSRRTILGILIVLALFSAVLLYKTKQLEAKEREYAAQEAALEQQLTEESAYTEELVEQEEYVKTKEYAEEMAKAKLGLVYPGETVLKPRSGN